LSERRPDRLSAEARRWAGDAGVDSNPHVVEAVLRALERDYDDVLVVRGIVRWRVARGLRRGEVSAALSTLSA
jgi:hypothetical protein